MNKLSHCKDCKSYWTEGVKDGKHNRWCCHFGSSAVKAVNHCKLVDAKKTSDRINK